MNALLFEDLWLLLAIGIIVSAFCIYRAMNRRTPLWRNAARIASSLFIVLLAMNYLVVTDREAIERQFEKVIKACEAGNADELAALLDDDFTATGMSKQDLIAGARDVFDRMRFEQIRVSGEEIKPPAIQFVAYTHIVGKGGTDFSWVRSDWRLEFRKRDQAWRLFDVRPLSVLMQPVKNMQEVMGRSRQIQ